LRSQWTLDGQKLQLEKFQALIGSAIWPAAGRTRLQPSELEKSCLWWSFWWKKEIHTIHFGADLAAAATWMIMVAT
jgi:hypothetical protein